MQLLNDVIAMTVAVYEPCCPRTNVSEPGLSSQRTRAYRIVGQSMYRLPATASLPDVWTLET